MLLHSYLDLLLDLTCTSRALLLDVLALERGEAVEHGVPVVKDERRRHRVVRNAGADGRREDADGSRAQRHDLRSIGEVGEEAHLRQVAGAGRARELLELLELRIGKGADHGDGLGCTGGGRFLYADKKEARGSTRVLLVRIHLMILWHPRIICHVPLIFVGVFFVGVFDGRGRWG